MPYRSGLRQMFVREPSGKTTTKYVYKRSMRAPGQKKVSKPLKQAIQRIVNKRTELKHVGQRVVDADFNSAIGAASECYPLVPAVTEGTDGHERIGDRIQGKWMTVKGKIMLSNSVSGDYIPPLTARIMILAQKNIKVSPDVSTKADVQHLLKDNIATDVGRAYTGTNFDNLAPINRDLFRVLMDRKFKFRATIAKQLGNNNTVTFADTNRTLYFVKRIRVPKTMTFDDGNGDYVNNFAPFLCCGCVTDDNSGPYTVGTPLHVTVESELYFTDA